MPWSYNTGERGRSWVRAYEDPRRGGALFLEWMEEVIGGDDLPVLDEKGRPVRRRARMKLPHRDYRRAEDDARILADRFALLAVGGEGTAHSLIDDYLREVTPTKGESKQDHDQRAGRLFKAVLPPQLLAADMDRSQWDGFIAARRAGLCELGPVGNRQIAYDLKFMISVLGWGVGTRRIATHPWGPEIRRTQRWSMPKNPKPLRPAMSDDIRALLIQHAGGGKWRFELALWLGRETVSRNSSVRLIQWRDVDFVVGTIEWRNEKNEWETTTPLSDRAMELLRRAPSRGIGEAYVFPSEKNPKVPCSRHSFQTWLRRAKRRLLTSITDPEQRIHMQRRLRGLGYHGEKRAAVRQDEFRRLPGKVREAIARTRARTLDDVYDDVSVDEMRAAIRASGAS